MSGTATALVTATGPATAFGDIAARLVAKPPETEFERGTRSFGYLILKTVVFLVLFVTLVCLIRRRDPLESLLFAVALAVGLTPEFLPMIVTVTLAQGAVHMSSARSSSSTSPPCKTSGAWTSFAATKPARSRAAS